MNGSRSTTKLRNLIVIGASTGGTRVITHLLSLLPPLPACIVIVQHMPSFINMSFARTLSRNAHMEVRLAADQDRLREGVVLLAPSEAHSVFVNNTSIRLVAGPKVNYVCPSIDVAMQSLRPPLEGYRLVGVLLTGMGRDGAAGLAHIKRLGCMTIAQDQASSAIYGMPAEAAKLGCVDHQASPAGIARLLVSHVR